MGKAWRRALTGLALSAVAGGAAAAEDHLWAKVGAIEATAASDLWVCERDSRIATYHLNTPQVVGGGAAGYLMSAAVGAVKENHAGKKFVRHCMKRHGYVWLPLEAAEQAALEKLKTPADRNAWIDRFYAGDLTARLDAAWKPVVPPLIPGQEEPLVFDGLRFDPSALTATAGPVTAHNPVLTGKASYSQTARLKLFVDIDVAGDLHADAGTILYRVVMPSDFEPEQTYWCGPFKATGLLGSSVSTYCVFADDNGYDFVFSGAEPWVAPPPDLATLSQFKSATVDLTLEPSDQALLGPLDFALNVQGIDKTEIDLEAVVTKANRKVTIWSGALTFDSDGKAVLPFWTHRLVLTRDGKSVTAAFTADGDGAGWLKVQPAFRDR